MNTTGHAPRRRGSLVRAITVACLCFAGVWIASSARAELLDSIDPRFKVGDRFKAATEAVARYAENTVSNARQNALRAADAALSGDWDGVAREVIPLSVGPSALEPFRETMISQLNGMAPGQIKKFRAVAAKNLEVYWESNPQRAKAYGYLQYEYSYRVPKDKYTATENGRYIAVELRSRQLSFSDYSWHSLNSAMTQADWSSPDAAAKSAVQIARDQWAAYSWYTLLTVGGGEAIGEGPPAKLGLTDQHIERGAADLVHRLKDNPDIGPVGALLGVEFMRAGKEAQCQTNGDYCPKPFQRICGNPRELHTMSLRNRTDKPIIVAMHVHADESHCENHDCDMTGLLAPGESRMCAVFGQWDAAKIHVRARASSSSILSPAFDTRFSKADGSSAELRFGRNGQLCMDVGNIHTNGCN